MENSRNAHVDSLPHDRNFHRNDHDVYACRVCARFKGDGREMQESRRRMPQEPALPRGDYKEQLHTAMHQQAGQLPPLFL
jgi:hypothetical protein